MNNGQTKLGSFLESMQNTASGFFVSLLVWMFVVGPIYGIQTPIMQSFSIVAIFTVSSLLRSYVIRRVQNWLEVNDITLARTILWFKGLLR